jgi:glycosyltransferase involved in cell wall biosynthesis
LYEGFGMPVLEAMACGAPVITSSTSALPEVAGDAAVLVNPEDADALSRAIRDILEDRGKRERLRELGLARAKSFTWHDAAVRTYALYRRLCA